MKKINLDSKFIIIALALALIIVAPILMDKLIIGNNILSNIANEQWVSFLGSYIGGIFGGMLSIIGVFATIKYYKNQDMINREEQGKIVLSEIKKQYEIKYKFEFLEELNNINKTLNIISDRFSTITILIYESNTENPLRCIDQSVWKNFKKLSIDLNNYYNNIKSIDECKLSVFYDNSFIKNCSNDIDALFWMTSEGFNNINKNTTIEKLEEKLLQIVNDWHPAKQINSIKDIEDWINDLKQQFLAYIIGFKQSI